MINTHQLIEFAPDQIYTLWRLDVLPIDIAKAQRIRHTKVRTDIQHAYQWLPQFCPIACDGPIAYAIKRSGRCAGVRVHKNRINTSSAPHFYLGADAIRIINLWDRGQAIEPITVNLFLLVN